jgi:hypothetical protein
MLLVKDLSLRNGLPVSSTLMVRDRLVLDRVMKKSLRGNDRVAYVSVIDALCDAERCRTVSDEDDPMTWDYGHLTVSGADYVVKNARVLKELASGAK